jgi:hypothetical protein
VPDLFIALIHHPVLDRRGRIVTSAITSLDVHDLARSARTFGVGRFFVIHPIAEQREFAKRVVSHWFGEHGRQHDSRRQDALRLVKVVSTLDDAVLEIEAETSRKPRIGFTSARAEGTIGYEQLRGELLGRSDDQAPTLLLFGTGFGLTDATLARAAFVLPAIKGNDAYNHLSVRGAASIVLDRLRGNR